MCAGLVPQAQRTHERWSIDFVHDQMIDGRSFRMLTVISCAGTPMSITVGHKESFNGRQRDECLNVTRFLSIDDAREQIERWRIDCNAWTDATWHSAKRNTAAFQITRVDGKSAASGSAGSHSYRPLVR